MILLSRPGGHKKLQFHLFPQDLVNLKSFPAELFPQPRRWYVLQISNEHYHFTKCMSRTRKPIVILQILPIDSVGKRAAGLIDEGVSFAYDRTMNDAVPIIFIIFAAITAWKYLGHR